MFSHPLKLVQNFEPTTLTMGLTAEHRKHTEHPVNGGHCPDRGGHESVKHFLFTVEKEPIFDKFLNEKYHVLAMARDNKSKDGWIEGWMNEWMKVQQINKQLVNTTQTRVHFLFCINIVCGIYHELRCM